MSKKSETQATLPKPAVKQVRAKVLPPVEAPRKISSFSVLRLARDYRRGESPDELRESFSLLDWKGKWYVFNVLLAEVFNGEISHQDGMFVIANILRRRDLAFNCMAARDCQSMAKVPITLLAKHGGYETGIVRVVGTEENGSFQPGKARLIYRFALEDIKVFLSFLEENKDGNLGYVEGIKILTRHIRGVEEYLALREAQDSR